MKNKVFTIAVLLLTCLAITRAQHPASNAAPAQTEKGATPLAPPSGGGGEVRAVIIGISDYQDPAIPDLQYAHRDAEAFAAWLSSGLPGLPCAAVTILLNDQATNGKIVAALSELISASKAGDLALIYFSGHGDVEQVTKFQRGYWLTYDSPPAVYAAGAFSLIYLQDIITTLAEADVQVVVVSDACRAGKLAGSEIGGAQATAAALSKQFANEVKILSCQPNEFSLEGEQWGGGRGVFSFHLLDALYGLADQDEDDRITVKELGRYLEDHVSTETAPHRQNPLVLGDREIRLARVDPEVLAQWRLQKSGDAVTLTRIDSRGLEDLALAKADSGIRILYEAFAAALERGDLMPADSTAGASANDYYERLIKEPALAGLHGLMTRNFAAALMDEGQQFINKLLKTDQFFIQQVLGQEIDYADIVAKTAKAAELLGEKHFAYRALKTKENFFRGSLASRQKDIARAKHFGLEALHYDPEAAYVYFFLTHFYKGDSLKLMVNRMDELLPNWVFGQAGVAMSLFANNEYRLSLKHSLKAISLDPEFLIPYGRTMANYYALHLPDSARIWEAALGEKVFNKVKNKEEKLYPIECLFGASCLSMMNRFRDANFVFTRGLEL
ncbi:MAG: caspase family protein, partial [Thermoanaerobaculia bacterium]|nr:caspase family protein [Thermoanaerobaculia bacterium]